MPALAMWFFARKVPRSTIQRGATLQKNLFGSIEETDGVGRNARAKND